MISCFDDHSHGSGVTQLREYKFSHQLVPCRAARDSAHQAHAITTKGFSGGWNAGEQAQIAELVREVKRRQNSLKADPLTVTAVAIAGLSLLGKALLDEAVKLGVEVGLFVEADHFLQSIAADGVRGRRDQIVTLGIGQEKTLQLPEDHSKAVRKLSVTPERNGLGQRFSGTLNFVKWSSSSFMPGTEDIHSDGSEAVVATEADVGHKGVLQDWLVSVTPSKLLQAKRVLDRYYGPTLRLKYNGGSQEDNQPMKFLVSFV